MYLFTELLFLPLEESAAEALLLTSENSVFNIVLQLLRLYGHSLP